ncbi:iron complex outermembrane recepter protein [Pseudomonas flavescens]|uniref:Metal-pseudopaline receptor CntO n=1 Tax=Phytopseudomonas flavescens TaxID=29435 RepID=A0A1G8C2D3_9GAMM|nr:TonB-dependent siderophore receptor [Pseudomonas flavescens]SDH39080.1 iron complex outermembrane recepter protein [Pseudomonas flavescens]
MRHLAPFPLVASVILAAIHAPLQAAEQRIDFALAAAPLVDTLIEIGQRSGQQVLFVPADVEGRQAAAVRGRLSASEAVSQALVGSGLSLRTTASGALSVQPTSSDQLTLSPTSISASGNVESISGPLSGYVAQRGGSATKTDTSLLETPQTVSVVTRDEMNDRKSDNLSDALKYTAGFGSQPAGFSRTADDFTLRGFNVGAGTGGILRDGMKLQANPYDGSVEAYGLERVEVVKGASSVLYGQLSPGGLINTISKRPTQEPLHEVGLELGNYDRRQYTFDLGGPLDEQGRFSYRLTGLWRDSGTQVDHVEDDRRYIAPAFTWRPNDDTSLTLLASHQETFTGFAPPMAYNLSSYSDTPGYKIGRDDFTGEPGYDHFNNRMDTLGYLFEHRFSDNLKVNHSLRYFQAHTDWDYLIPQAIVGTRLLRRYSERDERSSGWTTDNNLQYTLDAGRWQHTLLVGADYYHKTYDSHRQISATPAQLAPSLDLSNPVHTGYGVNTAADSGSDLHSAQKGFYLQDQIRFDERWLLLLGGRQDWAESRTTTFSNGARTSRDDKKATGRVGLVYLADNGLAPYVSYSQSFQPANVSNPAFGSSFAPLEGEQYEIGLRYQPPGSDTLISAAVYQLDQENALSLDAATGTYVQYGKTRSKGFELEAKTEATENLALTASYAYTDTHVLQDQTASNLGKRIEGVPYHSASLWASYRLGVFGLPRLRIAGGARYTGTTRTTPSTYAGKIPAYTLFDALVSYEVDEHWEVAAKAQNLSNEKYLYCGTTCRYGDERSLIGSLSYRW